MAGLVPAIHVFWRSEEKDVDARHKAGHDGVWWRPDKRRERFVTGKIGRPNHSGSAFDSLLAEDGILEEVEAVAIKRVIAMRKNGSIDRSETFDEFLAKDGLLAETEKAALKKVIADQKKARIKPAKEK